MFKPQSLSYQSDDVWRLCLSALHAENHTIIRRDAERRLYEVVPIKEAASMVTPQHALETTGTMPGYQSVVVPLNNIRAVRLIDRVESLLTLDAKLRVEPIEGENSVLASGTLERLEDAIELIRQIDEDKAPPAMYTIELRNRTASEVVPDVQSIIQALDKQGWLSVQSSLAPSPDGLHVRVFGPPSERERVESLIRESDQQAPIETRVLDTRGYPLDSVASYVTSMAKDDSSRGSGDAWEVDQDELTGALIVTGTPAELEAAEAALDRLGDLPAESKRVVSMIEVHHREASKLRGTVAQLLAARVLGEQGGGEHVQGRLSLGADPAHQQLAGIEDERSGEMSGLELTVDEEMNVIIATGTLRRIEQVKGLVEQLDVRQPQVQLEVVLLSLSESQTQDLGVELSGNIDTGKTLVGLGSLFGISSISPSSTSAQASGAGGSAVVLSPGDFSAVIRAIQTVNSGRSASMPSIVVNNNETATLNSTTTQPYLTTTITDSGTTTARGGSASAGTTITVSPQIAAGDHIVLDYSFTLSSFVGEASADGVEPPSQQTSLNSIATIPDGYTIVLGGIESTTEGDSNTKTPGLADIPLLGELFKSRSDSTSRSRFYVFIRATVMRSPSFEYLKYISEEMAESVQVEDGWPEVEPRFIR